MWLTVWTSGNRAECLASVPFRLGEVHFAVESRSGAVNGVLLEGPGLEGEASGEGPKVGPFFFGLSRADRVMSFNLRCFG